jgi:hypothetical protein
MSRHVAIADEIQHEKLAGGDDNALTETGTRGTSVDGSNYPDSATGLTHKEELKKAERKLLIKQGEWFRRSTHDLLHECLNTARADAPDAVILPFALLLYLSAYLDRGNMLVVSTLIPPLWKSRQLTVRANARLQGLQEEVLDGSDNNYSIALSCFFITYIVFSVSRPSVERGMAVVHLTDILDPRYTSCQGSPAQQVHRSGSHDLVHCSYLSSRRHEPRRIVHLSTVCRYRRR